MKKTIRTILVLSTALFSSLAFAGKGDELIQQMKNATHPEAIIQSFVESMESGTSGLSLEEQRNVGISATMILADKAMVLGFSSMNLNSPSVHENINQLQNQILPLLERLKEIAKQWNDSQDLASNPAPVPAAAAAPAAARVTHEDREATLRSLEEELNRAKGEQQTSMNRGDFYEEGYATGKGRYYSDNISAIEEKIRRHKEATQEINRLRENTAHVDSQSIAKIISQIQNGADLKSLKAIFHRLTHGDLKNLSPSDQFEILNPMSDVMSAKVNQATAEMEEANKGVKLVTYYLVGGGTTTQPVGNVALLQRKIAIVEEITDFTQIVLRQLQVVAEAL